MENTAHGEHYVADGELVCDRNICTAVELRQAELDVVIEEERAKGKTWKTSLRWGTALGAVCTARRAAEKASA